MKLLVLEDDSLFRKAISNYLSNKYSLVCVENVDEALLALDKDQFDCAIIDLNLGVGKRDGKEFLKEFKDRYPEKPVLVQSSARDIPTVVSCIKLGADDYIEKPFDAETLSLKVDKILCESRRTRVFKREYDKAAPEIVGRTPSLLAAKDTVRKAGSLRILLLGETGVGKTPFAQYSNRILSSNSDIRPFEQVNCSALQGDQLTDVLFGHKKGAFTGAVNDRRGLVELADGGDLFLDEVGEMPLNVQAMLLTFMDTMEYYRLGDDKKRTANVRIICATNRDLKKMIDRGEFRKDLYSRISQVVVEIPPLRDRADDIPLLFEYFVESFSGAKKPYAPDILPLLAEYLWDEGNVRELRDLVDYMCTVGRTSPRLEIAHMSPNFRPVSEKRDAKELIDSVLEENDLRQVYDRGFENVVEQIERDLFKRCLEDNPRCPEALAAKLRISKATLYRKLKKYGLSQPGKYGLLEESDLKARRVV